METNVTLYGIDAAQYRQTKAFPYVDVFQLDPLFTTLYARKTPPNLILWGPKGIAKSLSIRAFADKNKIPLILCSGSEDVRRSSLVGMFILKGGETPFVLGSITNAIQIANEYGQAILNVEEINALSPQMQKLFNPLCDFHQAIEVPECGRIFSVQPDKKLWVVGTMNSAVYGGTYGLNEDLKSRFRIKPLTYPTADLELKIILETVDGKPKANEVKQVLLLASETRQRAFSYALSTRDICQIVEDTLSLGLKEALRLSSGKLEEQDRETYVARIESIFGFRV